MPGLDMSLALRNTSSMRLTDTEAQIDMARLRAYRLGRVRGELVRRDLGACVLFDPINIRYATGHPNYSVFQTHIPGSYVFIPAEGPVTLFDARAALRVAEGLETIDACRPSAPLTYFAAGSRFAEWVGRWADEIADLVRRHCGGNARLAIGRTDPRVPAALEAHGIEVFDARKPVETARAIKSPDEIACMTHAIAVAEAGMARMRAALEPGMTEVELWSILHETNVAMGGEWVECRLLASGDRTNPWQQEAGSRVIRPGDLVAFDTDMVGPFGYCADISRTYHCGPGEPTPGQRELYKLAFEEVHHNIGLVKPGLGFREFTEKAWKQPEQYVANRYDVLAHGIGMCDEYPCIYYPADWERLGYDGVIEENMTLCVESYIGAEGGAEGVKLEQQVLVTARGCDSLSTFPFEEALLA